LVIVGASIIVAYSISGSEGPYLLFNHPILRLSGFVVHWGSLPFWLFVPLVGGLALLFFSLVVSHSSRLLLWTATMLFVVWALQVTGQLGIFRVPFEYIGETLPSVWVRQAYFTASAWGLVFLAVSLLAVGILDRLWKAADRQGRSSGVGVDLRNSRASV
jgi:hypothetical protein